jgi:hypothetical protein
MFLVTKRAIKLTVLSYWIPQAVCFLLFGVPWFFSYPPFPFEVWIALLIFSAPVLLFTIAGLFLRKKFQAQRLKHSLEPNPVFSSRANLLFLVLSVIYVAFMMYRYLFMGHVLSEGVTGARYLEIQSGPGQGGVVTGITIYLSAAPVFALLSATERLSKTGKVAWVYWGIGVLGLFASFLSGGRNSFLISIVYFLIMGAIVPELSFRRAIKGKTIRKLSLRTLTFSTFILAFGFSMYVFVDRGLMRSNDLVYRAIIAASENNIFFYPERKPDWLGDGVFFALLSLHNYITIGYHYFGRLMEIGLPNGTLGGSYMFFSFFIVFERITGFAVTANLGTDLPIIGAYYSLVGSIYIDFGYLGVMVSSILLPLLAAISVTKAQKGFYSWAPIAAVFLTMLLFSPLYSSISVGSGPSLLLFSLVFLISKRSIAKRF